MPRIQLSDPAIRNAYRQGLSPSEQRLFDQIVDSLKHPVGTLAWHHHLGELFRNLHIMMRGRRAPDLARLAVVFGPGASLFHKCQRFVRLYPSPRSLQEMEELGTDWTRLSLAFSVPNPKNRLALLREAQKKEWSIPELREQLHRRFPTDRKGIGGPERAERKALSPEGRVRELVRLCKEWDHIHSKLHPNARLAAWQTYARDLTESELGELEKKLKGLVRSTKGGLLALKSLAGLRPKR